MADGVYQSHVSMRLGCRGEDAAENPPSAGHSASVFSGGGPAFCNQGKLLKLQLERVGLTKRTGHPGRGGLVDFSR